jgi:hypothetical protein
MKTFIISIISCVVWIGAISAQSANDAFLFSRFYAGSTARATGMSGAFGALGGDLSVLSANPAGLAVYRGSEFTFTPGFVFTNTNARYAGNAFTEKNMHFSINNIGYVFTKNRYNERGLQSISFGMAYNRLSDFNSDTHVKQQMAKSSLLDEFLWYANGLDGNGIPVDKNSLHDFYEGLAYDTYAIDWDDDNNVKAYYSDYTNHGYGQPLYRTMSTRGGIGAYDFSIGLNFNHKFFWGASLGLQNIRFQEYWYHEETPGFDFMKSFNFTDEYTANGFGINFKTGVIYRPIQALRFGAAIHAPTYLWMRPYKLTKMKTYWNESPSDDGITFYHKEIESTPNDPDVNYRMTTPWRYNLSVATVIGKFGMANVDMEVVNYSNSNIKTTKSAYDKSMFDPENEDISNDLKAAVNVKGGAEFRLGPVFLRGGMAFYGNPYNKNSDSFDDPDIQKTLKGTMSFSGGIGFRARDFYMDAAYSYLKHPERVNNLYLSHIETTHATLRPISNKIIITFGFRF